VGRCFRPAPALGYGLVVSLGLPLRLHSVPTLAFTLLGAYYCHCGVKIEIWAFYGFG